MSTDIEPAAIIEQTPASDIFGLIERLAEQSHQAQLAGQPPTPFAVGTFAMYVTADKGLMIVTEAPEGAPLAGTNRMRVPHGIVRALTALMAGGSKFDALKAMMGKGPKAING